MGSQLIQSHTLLWSVVGRSSNHHSTASTALEAMPVKQAGKLRYDAPEL